VHLACGARPAEPPSKLTWETEGRLGPAQQPRPHKRLRGGAYAVGSSLVVFSQDGDRLPTLLHERARGKAFEDRQPRRLMRGERSFRRWP